MTDEANHDWLKLQQQYWDTYLNMTHQAIKQTATMAKNDNAPDASPWVDSLEVYWKTLSPLVQPEAKEVMEKFVTQGQQFFHFATTFLKVFHQAPNDADPELWQQYFDEFKQTLADFTNDQHQGLSFWELPIDNWQRAVSSLSLLPEGFVKNLKPNHLSQDVYEQMQRWLLTPGVSYTREWQDQMQESTRLWMVYQKAHQEYHNILSRVGTRTVDLMQEKAVKLQEQHKKIENLRQLYDLWIDCGEIAYAEIVNTDEYAEINARLVNTLMAWKKHERCMIDEMLSSMNMPTRKELDSLHLRLQQLRRETRILKAKQYEERIDDVKSEVVQLRTELESLKKQQKQQSTVQKKTTTRRRRTTKATEPKTGE